MTRLRDSALFAAIGLGVLADFLWQPDGRPGLNAPLLALAGAAALGWLWRLRNPQAARESRWLLLAAAAFAALLAWRDAEALAVLDLLAILVLVGLAAGRGARAWAATAELQALAAAAARVEILILLGPVGWSLGPARVPGAAPTGHGPRVRHLSLERVRGSGSRHARLPSNLAPPA